MSKLDEVHKKYSDSFSEFTDPIVPKANWFEVYIKKEKDFNKAIRDIDLKISLLVRTLAETEQRIMSKLERLEDKIDYMDE